MPESPLVVILTDLRGQYRTVLTSMLQGQAELTIFGAPSRFRQNLAQLEARWLRRQAQQANLTGLSQSLMIFGLGINRHTDFMVSCRWY